MSPIPNGQPELAAIDWAMPDIVRWQAWQGTTLPPEINSVNRIAFSLTQQYVNSIGSPHIGGRRLHGTTILEATWDSVALRWDPQSIANVFDHESTSFLGESDDVDGIEGCNVTTGVTTSISNGPTPHFYMVSGSGQSNQLFMYRPLSGVSSLLYVSSDPGDDTTVLDDIGVGLGLGENIQNICCYDPDAVGHGLTVGTPMNDRHDVGMPEAPMPSFLVSTHYDTTQTSTNRLNIFAGGGGPPAPSAVMLYWGTPTIPLSLAGNNALFLGVWNSNQNFFRSSFVVPANVSFDAVLVVAQSNTQLQRSYWNGIRIP